MLTPLGVPRPVRVEASPGGEPLRVDAGGHPRRVLAVRDDWLVQDRWWPGHTGERHHFERVLDPGRVAVVYREADGSWHAHP